MIVDMLLIFENRFKDEEATIKSWKIFIDILMKYYGI